MDIKPWFKVVKENETEVMYPTAGAFLVVVSVCAFLSTVIYLSL